MFQGKGCLVLEDSPYCKKIGKLDRQSGSTSTIRNIFPEVVYSALRD